MEAAARREGTLSQPSPKLERRFDTKSERPRPGLRADLDACAAAGELERVAWVMGHGTTRRRRRIARAAGKVHLRICAAGAAGRRGVVLLAFPEDPELTYKATGPRAHARTHKKWLWLRPSFERLLSAGVASLMVRRKR